MKPDTSRWRDNTSYDFFDSLPVEGLAWECLRRWNSYQRLYAALARSGAETQPFPTEAQKRWGLRFRRSSRPVLLSARHFVVTTCQPRSAGPRAFTGFPVIRPFHGARRDRCLSRQSGGVARHP
ncbi:transcriptional regulator domain-containing protein [Bradyrhizobium sp. Arg314]